MKTRSLHGTLIVMLTRTISTKAKRWFLAVLFIILMVEVVVIAPKEIGVSSRTDSPLLSQVESGDSQQQTMSGVHLIESKGSQKDWELWADKTFTTHKGAVWKLEKVRIRFFGEGDVKYDVTGQEGEVEVNTKDIEIRGQVEMHSSNGYRFRTDRIKYNSGKRQMSTKDPVRMWGDAGVDEPPIELTGVALEADLNTNEIHILNSVRSKRKMSSGEYVYIESDKAEFSSAHRFAKYLGDVTIDYKGSRVTGPSARFDYDPTIKGVGRLIVEGGGRVTDLTKWATAKTIEMLFKENKFILKGGPRVVQDNDELVGEEIVFLDGGREIMVNKAKANFAPRSEGE